jgi:hypothetical protein
MPPIEVDNSLEFKNPIPDLNKNKNVDLNNDKDNNGNEKNKNFQIKKLNNEEIVLIPTPIDYQQFMKMQYSKDFSKFEDKDFLGNNLEKNLNIDSNINSNYLQGGLIPKYLKDFYSSNKNNITNLNFLEQKEYDNQFQNNFEDQKNNLINLNYANEITKNAHIDMGLINNKPLASNILGVSDSVYDSNSKFNTNSNINFMESVSKPQIIIPKEKLNYVNDNIDITKFMKSQEDDIQKYFNKLNKLEYEKVYNRINNINKEQEIFNKIKNSDGNLNYNDIWREFQISNNKMVKNIIYKYIL